MDRMVFVRANLTKGKNCLAVFGQNGKPGRIFRIRNSHKPVSGGYAGKEWEANMFLAIIGVLLGANDGHAPFVTLHQDHMLTQGVALVEYVPLLPKKLPFLPGDLHFQNFS